MARPIWTGSVAFGLVNVPVVLYTATEDRTVHFNQFQAGTADRIRYKRVNERTGREVKLADIVRGHEVSKGDYVLVTDEELEAIDPGRSRTIDMTDFADLAEIDPIYFQRTYYLAPQDTYRERVEELIERKQRGEEIVTEVAAPEDSSVVDLADALRRSVQAQQRRQAGGRPAAGTQAKRSGGARSAGRKTAAGGTSRTRSAPKAKNSRKRKAG